jgi:kynurenine formamidase
MSRRLLFSIFLISILLTGCQKQNSPDLLESGRIIDLTHSFSEETIYWPTAESFKLETVFKGQTENNYFYSAYQFCAAEHGGTHLDAPVHFAEGKQASDEIPLENLTGRGVVVNVSDKALNNKDYLISINDFTQWEKQNGRLPESCIILVNTGYAQYWPDREKYMGTAELGQDAIKKLHFPGLDPAAAEWLVQNRTIKSIGLDTPSIDYGQSTLFESHRILFKENIPAFENVANLDQLPVKNFYIVALPMKIKGGSGGPLRIIALVP